MTTPPQFILNINLQDVVDLVTPDCYFANTDLANV